MIECRRRKEEVKSSGFMLLILLLMQPVTAIFVDEMLPSASIDFFRSRGFLLRLGVPGDCPGSDPGGEDRVGMASYEDIG